MKRSPDGSNPLAGLSKKDQLKFAKAVKRANKRLAKGKPVKEDPLALVRPDTKRPKRNKLVYTKEVGLMGSWGGWVGDEGVGDEGGGG